MKLLGLQHFTNDIKDVNQNNVVQKIKKNTQFSFSFLILLISSTIICTLGLLLGSTPIVIGGMLISPLMWPLMKIAIGVSHELKSFIKQALSLLLLSVIIILGCSFIIAYISPIKLVNPEILSRTNPTLLDIFVAFAAGAIAAFAILQKKISDSLAGVAIAISLLPPLCVSGIGIALFNYQIASGAFLLFLANVVSIIFISIFVFIFSGIKKNGDKPIRFRGIALITIILIFTSLPLISFLANYSFKSKAYSISQDVLVKYFKSVSTSISVQNVKTTIQKSEGQDIIFINADVLIPEEITLDYNQKNEIVRKLEVELKKKIDLNLRIQKSIALQSKDAIVYGSTKETLIKIFREKLLGIDNAISISSLDVYRNEYNPYWKIDAVLLSDPGISLTEDQRSDIESTLRKKINQLVILNIELVPRLKLKSQPDLENEKIKNDIKNILGNSSKDIDIESIVLQNNKPEGSGIVGEEYAATISVQISKGFSFTQIYMDEMKSYLSEKYNKNFKIKVITTERTIYEPQ